MLGAAAAVPLTRMTSPARRALRGPALTFVPAGGPAIDPSTEIGPAAVPEPIDGDTLWSGRARSGPPTPSELGRPSVAEVPSVDSAVPFIFKRYDFVVSITGTRPYAMSRPLPASGWGVVDRYGVRMIDIAGKLYDHPVAQAEYGINLVESYQMNPDPRYLALAKLQAQRLIDRVIWWQQSWFYPYPFAYRVHALYDLYQPPWFSQMAQGQALTLFCRLAKLTGDPMYRSAADYTFRTFLVPPVAGHPWGVYVVDGLLWFDEYPNPRAVRGDRTYNGHMFAAWGLWDYWALTGSPDAKLMLQGALTTYLDANRLVRHAGWQSRYCLTHGRDAGPYHSTHIGQLAVDYALTGSLGFARDADLLYADYPLREAGGTVLFAAGSHTGYRFGSTGQMLAAKTINPVRATSAPNNGRDKVMNRLGIWYNISAGSFAGYRVRETGGSVYQLGEYSNLGYRPPRSGRVRAAPLKAYQVSATGTMTGVVTTYTVGASLSIDVRAYINGREHLRLFGGPYAGHWVGASYIDIVR